LQRIIAKGYIKSEPKGRVKLYSPKVSRDYIDKQSQNIINILYNDSVQNFIAGLYQNNALSKQDLQDLKAYLEELLKEN
jgi:predicted transcriptional regulator